MQAGAKSKKPIGSKRLMTSLRVGLVFVLSLVSGIRMTATIAKVIAPAGRLI